MKTQGPARKRGGKSNSWRPYLAAVVGTLFTLGAISAAGAHDASELLDARTILKEIKKREPANTPATSPASQLMAEIRRFRSMSDESDPDAAAAWLALLDRALKTGLPQQSPEAASFDPDLRRPVSVQSVVAALPGPSAWPALREQALQRAARSAGDYRQRGLALLAAVLLGDRAAADADLKAIDAAITSLSPEERTAAQMRVAAIRRTLTSLYGDPESMARAFLESVVRAASGSGLESGEDFGVPDLVTLVGDSEATKILTTALAQPISLHVESGDATRALARRIALEHIDSLKAPQWALVDSIDAAPLYEALSRRFGTTASAQDAKDTPGFFSDEGKANADTYYLLFLIVNGKLPAAQNLLESIAAGRSLEIPEVAIAALQKAQQNEALYVFLGSVLSKHPEVQAWDVYIEQAAYTGHGREALATLDTVLKRTGIPSYLRADLQRRRADALLALDDVPAALQAFDNLLRPAPSVTDQFAQQRADSALRLAGVGRVIGRADVAAKGLRFVEDTLALPAQGPTRTVDRATLLREWFAEARSQHRETEVQRVATAEFGRADSSEEAMAHQMEAVGMPGVRQTKRIALVELLSLYAAASRYADVRVLLDESENWGARDLRTLLTEKDSLGVPVALSAARALASLGDSAVAIRMARATIAEFPGYDGAYELESSIDPAALDVFAAQFKADQFEERPLIWKAAILAQRSDYAAAEQAVRAAIAIDPSDGEEGVNDRMRAYSVLADILEAKGDPGAATEFRAIVASIRISEHSDEFYKLGLYQRAFAGYREALGHFSDAYCIQSRLAVQLNKQGQHAQAAEHYRRAYELMPASFGRVESHCFGCESVFEGAQPQSIAAEVFQSLAKKDPQNPRVHYLQGYLLEEEGRYAEALPAFRAAVQIDESYLNAWRHLQQVGEHIYLNAGDRDVATIKLLELDPQQRHGTYDTGRVGDFRLLWNTVAQLKRQSDGISHEESLYTLKQSASRYDQKQAQLPAELRARVQEYETVMGEFAGRHDLPYPSLVLAKHPLLMGIAGLLGEDDLFGEP